MRKMNQKLCSADCTAASPSPFPSPSPSPFPFPSPPLFSSSSSSSFFTFSLFKEALVSPKDETLLSLKGMLELVECVVDHRKC